MGILQLFDIEFSRSPALYSPGQTLEGNVVLEVKEQLQLRNIRLHFVGDAKTIVKGSTAEAENVAHEQNDIFFDQVVLIWPPTPSPENKSILGPDRYTFPFSYTLPKRCPCSFEQKGSNHGEISYFCQATIATGKWWKIDPKVRKNFYVTGTFDLNVDPDESLPVDATVTKNLRFWSDMNKISVHLPKHGFLPGETVNIKADISNKSSERVKKIEVQLLQNVYLTAQSHTTSTVNFIHRAAYDFEVKPKSEAIWGGDLIIPSSLPPTLKATRDRKQSRCSIVQINYEIALYLVASNSILNSGKSAVTVPIDIGTVAIKERSGDKKSRRHRKLRPVLRRIVRCVKLNQTMGILQLFDIEFSRSPALYSPGQTLEGNVVLEVKEQLQLRNIRLHFVGDAKTIVKGSTAEAENVAHEQNDIFFDQVVLIWPPTPSPENKSILGPDRYTFPFSYTLPKRCPCSFEQKGSNHGEISYFCQATIATGKWWKIDPKVRKNFYVTGTFDLNVDPDESLPVDATVTKNLRFWSDMNKISVHLPKHGFLPGETVNIKADISNKSSERVKKIEVQLLQNVYLTAQSHTTSTVNFIHRAAYDFEVKPKSEAIWGGDLIIPSSLPPTLKATRDRKQSRCSIVQINYEIALYLVASNSILNSGKSAVTVPIDIGTVAIKERSGDKKSRRHRKPRHRVTSTPAVIKEEGEEAAAEVEERVRVMSVETDT